MNAWLQDISLHGSYNSSVQDLNFSQSLNKLFQSLNKLAQSLNKLALELLSLLNKDAVGFRGRFGLNYKLKLLGYDGFKYLGLKPGFRLQAGKGFERQTPCNPAAKGTLLPLRTPPMSGSSLNRQGKWTIKLAAGLPCRRLPDDGSWPTAVLSSGQQRRAAAILGDCMNARMLGGDSL